MNIQSLNKEKKWVFYVAIATSTVSFHSLCPNGHSGHNFVCFKKGRRRRNKLAKLGGAIASHLKLSLTHPPTALTGVTAKRYPIHFIFLFLCFSFNILRLDTGAHKKDRGFFPFCLNSSNFLNVSHLMLRLIRLLFCHFLF